MSDLKAQLEISADASGVEAGVSRAKGALKDLGATAVTAGKQASDGIANIGAGGDASAKKVDSATRSIIQSIQRTTAVMEAGSRTSSKYFEVLAQQRGVSVEALKPYLAQLDAVSEKQAAANQALNATNPAMQKLGVSAAQTAAALRGVPAQFTDIITSLQGGQAPMTVFLQQGGQLKDMFGGIGPAAKALGGYILGLVNPFTVAAAAGVGLAYAAHKGREEFDALNNTMKLTGGYTGQTTKQIMDMAARLGATSGNISEATEALRLLIATGKVGGDQLEGFGKVVLQMAKATGGGVKDAVSSLAGLSDDAVKWAEKYNEQYHFMTAAQYALAKQYQDTGDKAAATKVIIEALQEAHTRMYGKASEEVGFLQKYYEDWSRGVDKIKRGLLGLGAPDTNFEKINKALSDRELLEKQLKFNQDARNDQQVRHITKLLESNRDYINSLRQVGDAEREQAAKNKKVAEESARAVTLGNYLDDPRYADKKTKYALEVQKENEAFKKAVAGFNETSKEYEQALARHKANLAQIAEQNKEKAPKVAVEISDYEKLAKTLAERISVENAAFASTTKLTEAEKIRAKMVADLATGVISLTEKERARANVQLDVLDTLEKSRKASAEIAKVYADYAADMEKSVSAAIKEAETNERLAKTYGMTKGEIEALELARLEEQYAQRSSIGLTLDEITNLEKLIAAKKRSAAAMASVDAQEASAKAAKDAAAEWKRSFDDVSRSLTDAIMRGGKSAGEYLRDYFRTLTLRPIVQAIVNPVAGAIAGVFGLNNLANAATPASSFAQSANMFSMGQTMWNGFSSGFSGFENMIANAATGAMNIWGGTPSVASKGWVSAEGGMAYNSPFAQTAGTAASYLGGGAIGIYGGRAISNGYAITGSGNGLVNAGTGAGAIIGAMTAVGGPLGALIGGLAAGVANRLFGRKLKDSGIEGSITGDQFTGSGYEFYKGGVFRKDKVKPVDLDPVVKAAIGATVDQLHASFEGLGKSIGAGAGLLDDFSHSFKVSLKDLSKEDAQKAIDRALASTSDAMAESFVGKFRAGQASALEQYVEDIVRIFDKEKASLAGVTDSEGKLSDFTKALFGLGDALSENEGFIRLFGEALDFDKLEASAKAGESVMDAFARLNTVFAATNSVAATLGKDIHAAFGVIGVASTEARQRLIDLTGGIDSLAAGNSFFSENFLSEAERLAPIQKAVAEEMARLGQASVTTHEQFGALVKGLDLSTESDARLYAGLMKVQGAFDIVADAAVVAAENERTLAEKRMGLQEQIMQLEGNAAGAMASQRERELASMEESLRPLQERIWLLQDEATAAAKAKEAAHAAADAALGFVDAAFAGLQRSVQAERANIQTIYDGEVKAIRDRAEAAKKAAQEQARISSGSLSTIKGVFNSLDSTLKAVMPMSRMAAQGILKSALELSNAGGSLSNVAGLEEALQVISRPDESQFATLVDFKRDQVLTAQTVAALKANAGDQVSVAQMTLDAINASIESIDTTSAAELAALDARHGEDITRLDGILSSAQAQLDALNGIDTSVLSVEAAIMRLAGSISAAKLNPVVSAASQVSDAYKSELGRAASQSEISFWKDQVAGGRSTSDVIASIANSREAQIVDLYRSLLGREADQAGLQHQYSSGLSIDQIRANIMSSDEYLKRIRGFSVGTNWVPKDMFTKIHEGERIVPKADNTAMIAALRNPQGNNEVLVAEIRALRAEVARLRETNSAENQSIAQHTNNTAKTLVRLSPDGNTLAVKVEA